MAKHSKTLRRGRGRSRSRSTRRQTGGFPPLHRAVTVGGRSRNRSSRRQRGGLFTHYSPLPPPPSSLYRRDSPPIYPQGGGEALPAAAAPPPPRPEYSHPQGGAPTAKTGPFPNGGGTYAPTFSTSGGRTFSGVSPEGP